MTRRTREPDWNVHLVIDAERETTTGYQSQAGALKIQVDPEGRWTVRVSTEGQTFTLILQGDATTSAPALLHQTLAFLFRQVA